MRQIIARLLLAFSSAILATGAVVHGAAFPRAANALGSTGLAPHWVSAFKMLWLGDSSTLISIAIVFAYVAARAPRLDAFVIALVTLNPLATAILLYHFLGGVSATYLIAGAALSGLVAAAMYSVPPPISSRAERSI